MLTTTSGRMIWALAAALLVAVGFVMLRACDFAIFPLYGHKYCLAAHSGTLAAERARMAELQADLQQAELTYAQKPNCALPQPEIKPILKTEQHDEPQPKQQEPEPEKLKVPKKLSELQGCWESERGDISIVTDDEEKRPIGNVRKCYCFGARGSGQLKLLYTIGVKCGAPVSARLENGKLRMSYPTFTCMSRGKNWGLVPAVIECENGDNDAATCTEHDLGHNAETIVEQYRRVERDHCGD